jgi:hypothetical protein
MDARRVSRQRLGKHVPISALNNKTNIYLSLLGNSQRTSEVAG